MSVRSQAYQISVFKRYYSDQHFSEFYLGPTGWRRKPAERNETNGTKLRHCHLMYFDKLILN